MSISKRNCHAKMNGKGKDKYEENREDRTGRKTKI